MNLNLKLVKEGVNFNIYYYSDKFIQGYYLGYTVKNLNETLFSREIKRLFGLCVPNLHDLNTGNLIMMPTDIILSNNSKKQINSIKQMLLYQGKLNNVCKRKIQSHLAFQELIGTSDIKDDNIMIHYYKGEYNVYIFDDISFNDNSPRMKVKMNKKWFNNEYQNPLLYLNNVNIINISNLMSHYNLWDNDKYCEFYNILKERLTNYQSKLKYSKIYKK